jgi:hypothetical protein
VEDLGRGFALLVATVAVAVVVGWQLLGRGDEAPRREAVIFGVMLCVAFGASMASRLHPGGAENVLMFWSTFGCSAVGVAGTWCEQWAGSALASAQPHAFVVAQVLALTFNPAEKLPAADDMWEDLHKRTRELEANGGEVLVLSHGGVSAHAHAHTMAVSDLMGAEPEMPAQILAPFDEQRFRAIILDNVRGLNLGAGSVNTKKGALLRAILANYYLAERLAYEGTSAPIGLPTTPNVLLLPRKHRLIGVKPPEMTAQLRVEFGIIVVDSATNGLKRPLGDATVEDRARAIVAGRTSSPGSPPRAATN